MANPYYPTQMGYLPTGSNGVANTSTFVVGRDITANYEAVGLGAGGRPDYAQEVVFNLTYKDGPTLTKRGTISLNVGDLYAAKLTNPNVPTDIALYLQEVAVCDNGVEKRMMIIASDPYSVAP
jgi:hypothetical protein